MHLSGVYWVSAAPLRAAANIPAVCSSPFPFSASLSPPLACASLPSPSPSLPPSHSCLFFVSFFSLLRTHCTAARRLWPTP
eukprot:1041920-Rhodomonas_salina.1